MKFSAPLIFLVGLSPIIAQADIITGYVNNPTGDSTDFATGISALGGSLTTLDVSTLASGPLNPAAFLGSNGVTLTGTGNFTNVSAGPGPGQGNVSSGPLSPGEGPHPAVNDIGGNSTAGTLTVSFATPVLGAGLFLIDLFNPAGVCGATPCDDVTIQAFTGAAGAGSLLGTFDAAGFNFQPNHLYFMGISSSGGDVGSIVLSQLANSSGDVIALGNIEYGVPASTVPEPSAIILLLPVVAMIGILYRRRASKCPTTLP